MVEHMHGTLKGMLTKARSQGLDWVLQLPFTMFALRQGPHRDTGLSPYELVFGRQVRMPLELVYLGWAGKFETKYDVCTWVEMVCDRLEIARDVAREKLEVAQEV